MVVMGVVKSPPGDFDFPWEWPKEDVQQGFLISRLKFQKDTQITVKVLRTE